MAQDLLERVQKNFNVKRVRAYCKNQQEKQVLYEKHAKDKDYAPGRGLDIGATGTVSTKRKRKKRTHCVCGATSHLSRNSKLCPMNKKNHEKDKGVVEEETNNICSVLPSKNSK